MKPNRFRKATATLFSAAVLLAVSEARAAEPPVDADPAQREDKGVTLVPEQGGPAACATGGLECARWYYLTEKPRPDAWNEDHPAFSKRQRWYHVGRPEPEARPRVIVLEGVRFDFDKATLKPESVPILERQVPTLKSETVRRVTIQGHADSRGTDAYNRGLSERRARTIKEFFVSRGVPEDRLETEGRGESEPIAVNEPHQPGVSVKEENDTLHKGRAMNRRVELHIEDVVATR